MKTFKRESLEGNKINLYAVAKVLLGRSGGLFGLNQEFICGVKLE